MPLHFIHIDQTDLLILWSNYAVYLFSSHVKPMGNTAAGRLSDCHSSHTELQQSRGSRVEWINKQNDSSCRWICFCPCLWFFTFSSHQSVWFLVPQSPCTMFMMYIIDCSLSTGLMFKAALGWFRCWYGCRSNSNH